MKIRTRFTCQSCGHEEPRWLGRCPHCGSWNSFEEIKAGTSATRRTQTSGHAPVPLNAIETKDKVLSDSGIEELNRVLGGGIVTGSTILVGGEPGIGKSTLMLQLAASMKTKGRVLYVTGEESAEQIKRRAGRLAACTDTIEVFCETNLSSILKSMETLKPVLVIIDSIQTIHSDEAGAIPGTPSQVKTCTYELNEHIKRHGSSLFLIGHVTKEGIIAGPKIVEHLVDTVLYFDQSDSDVRILRSTKNRFGATHEIGLFTMTEKGLLQVADPSSLFLEHRETSPPSGVVVAAVYEGTRALMVEVQSLVVPVKGGISRVFSDKIDSRRVSRLAAVLEKHLQVAFSDVDIYVNIAGGIKITEVGIDLAICLSLYSARTDLLLPPKTAVVGEVSLAGELRSVTHTERRIKSAYEMGFSHIIGPALKEEEKAAGISYKGLTTVKDAVRTAFTQQ
ncbi:MAG: DNA repair protein RadA [Spirochaetales bacterium]|nr:DNA repair protein RadA [Spirochaetales bacterium]